jgi:hypothetical protein
VRLIPVPTRLNRHRGARLCLEPLHQQVVGHSQEFVCFLSVDDGPYQASRYIDVPFILRDGQEALR